MTQCLRSVHELTNTIISQCRYTETLYRYYDQKNNAQEEIILLNCELDTTEENLIQVQHELANKNNKIQVLFFFFYGEKFCFI